MPPREFPPAGEINNPEIVSRWTRVCRWLWDHDLCWSMAFGFDPLDWMWTARKERSGGRPVRYYISLGPLWIETHHPDVHGRLAVDDGWQSGAVPGAPARGDAAR